MGEVDVTVLREATLDIYTGEYLAIVGPSGSGKSTLLNIIGGMDRPSTGQIFFNEKDLSTVSDHALTLFRRNQIGFIFQSYNLIPTLTALENVQVANRNCQGSNGSNGSFKASRTRIKSHSFSGSDEWRRTTTSFNCSSYCWQTSITVM